MDILYDDKHITVCTKEPRLLSEKSESGEDIITKLNIYYKKSGQSAEAFPLHRLDFGVGGVMVFAKNRAAAAKMSLEIQEGRLEKHYLAVLIGKPEDVRGIYKDLLFKDSKKNKSFTVSRKRAGVREASLEYELISTRQLDDIELSLVKIKLHTGRSHQIRVQFSSRKTPLFGDRKYGAGAGSEIALWSYKLSFNHPFSKEPLVFEKMPDSGVWNMFI